MTQCRARLQTKDCIVCCLKPEGHSGEHRGEASWMKSNVKDAK